MTSLVASTEHPFFIHISFAPAITTIKTLFSAAFLHPLLFFRGHLFSFRHAEVHKILTFMSVFPFLGVSSDSTRTTR